MVSFFKDDFKPLQEASASALEEWAKHARFDADASPDDLGHLRGNVEKKAQDLSEFLKKLQPKFKDVKKMTK